MTNILNKYVSSSANQLCLTLAILLFLILIMMWISDWGVDWLCWSGYYAPLCPPNSPHYALPTPQLGELGTHQCTGLDKNIKTPNSTTQPTPQAHGQAAFRRLELSHVIFSQDWFGCGCFGGCCGCCGCDVVGQRWGEDSPESIPTSRSNLCLFVRFSREEIEHNFEKAKNRMMGEPGNN